MVCSILESIYAGVSSDKQCFLEEAFEWEQPFLPKEYMENGMIRPCGCSKSCIGFKGMNWEVGTLTVDLV